MLLKYIKKFYDKYANKGIYSIGILNNTIQGVINGEPMQLRRIKNPYNDRWWADPFIVDVTQEYIIILVEEVYYKKTGKGHITKLKVDRSSLNLLSSDVVLELDTHLSFPCFFKHNNKVYLYPENAQSGHLSIYEYDYRQNIINKVGVICDDRIVDAVIFPYCGITYLFATKAPLFNGNRLDIYKYNERKKAFVYDSHILFTENIARGAGNFFRINEKWYRPAQECNDRYGHALSIQEVSFDPQNGFSFREIRRILPFDKEFHTGVHTLNMFEQIIVVDHYKYQYLIDPFLKALNSFIRMFIRKEDA